MAMSKKFRLSPGPSLIRERCSGQNKTVRKIPTTSETLPTFTRLCSMRRRCPGIMRTVMFCLRSKAVKSTEISALSAPKRIISSSWTVRKLFPKAVKPIASSRLVFPWALAPHKMLTPPSKHTRASSMFRKLRMRISLHSMIQGVPRITLSYE